MGWISGSRGVFRLDESDEYCGSLIRLPDLSRILGVEQDVLRSALRAVKNHDDLCVNELDVHKAWSNGKIPGAPASRVRRATVRLDELLLAAIVDVTLPGAS